MLCCFLCCYCPGVNVVSVQAAEQAIRASHGHRDSTSQPRRGLLRAHRGRACHGNSHTNAKAYFCSLAHEPHLVTVGSRSVWTATHCVAAMSWCFLLCTNQSKYINIKLYIVTKPKMVLLCNFNLKMKGFAHFFISYNSPGMKCVLYYQVRWVFV